MTCFAFDLHRLKMGFISLLGVLMILVTVLAFLKIASPIIMLEETISVVRIFLGISGLIL
jgi:hypothetical protein